MKDVWSKRAVRNTVRREMVEPESAGERLGRGVGIPAEDAAPQRGRETFQSPFRFYFSFNIVPYGGTFINNAM